MNIIGGLGAILFIVVMAGAIAYVGDRVGHRVGRARLTLFGLRPKYTSTIVAVGTGMLIALAVTLVAVLASQYVKTAFFRIGQLNDRINQLQAEADALVRNTHEENVVVNRGDLLYPGYFALRPTQSDADRARLLGQFFDAVVAQANRTYGPQAYGPRALRPMTQSSTDPDVQKKLRQLLTDVDASANGSTVIVLALADENLFPNDPIHFRFQAYPDKLIFRAHETIAMIRVNGGTSVNPLVLLSQLAANVEVEAVRRGMPYLFAANAVPVASEARLTGILRQISNGKGTYILEARAASDIYPHLGGLPIELSLVGPGSR